MLPPPVGAPSDGEHGEVVARGAAGTRRGAPGTEWRRGLMSHGGRCNPVTRRGG